MWRVVWPSWIIDAMSASHFSVQTYKYSTYCMYIRIQYTVYVYCTVLISNRAIDANSNYFQHGDIKKV